MTDLRSPRGNLQWQGASFSKPPLKSHHWIGPSVEEWSHVSNFAGEQPHSLKWFAGQLAVKRQRHLADTAIFPLGAPLFVLSIQFEVETATPAETPTPSWRTQEPGERPGDSWP
jgi:hypothetical protein